MNERIKQIWDEAAKLEPDPSWEGQTRFMEKFAELIILECARLARATPAPNFHEHLKQQLGHTWDMACAEAGNQIIAELK